MRIEYATEILDQLDKALRAARATNQRIMAFHLTPFEMDQLRSQLSRTMSPAPELNYTSLEYEGIPCLLQEG